jgi:hypothetical protein
MNATTIARVKALLDISGTTYDTVLTTMVEAVSRRIENYIDRPLEQVARTEEYSIKPRQSVLFLRAYPTTAIASIKLALDWDYASEAAIESDDYHVDEDTGMVHFTFFPILNYRGDNLAAAPNVIQVIYTGGFATSTANLITSYPDIAYAADLQVVAMWRRRDSPQGQSQGIGGGSITYEGALRLVPDVIEALTPYRRLRFAANG